MEYSRQKVVDEQEITIAYSVPGVDPSLATAILTEMAMLSDFSSENQIASWAGLAPSVISLRASLSRDNIKKMISKWLG